MSNQQPPNRRQPLTLYHLYLAGRFHLLAAATYMCLLLILEMQGCQHAFARLAWRLGPWSNMPPAYDLSRDPLFDGSSQLAAILGTVLVAAPFVALFLIGSHLLLIALLVAAHRRFGWPGYWREVQPRIDFWPVWLASARRCWWVWPVSQFIWLLFSGIAVGMERTFYCTVSTTGPYLMAHLAVVVGFVSVLTNRALRTAVVGAVRPDDVRCYGCGYLLRGLSSDRCPECGLDHRTRTVRYSFTWQRSGRWRGIRQAVLIVLAAVLLLAPVWGPSALLALPRSWLEHLPAALQPHYTVLYESYRQNSPIPINMVCAVSLDDSYAAMGQENPVAVLRFERSESGPTYLIAEHWNTKEQFLRRESPNTTSRRRIWKTSSSLPFGASELWYWTNGQDMIWLLRPHPWFSVEVYDPDRLPEALRDLEREPPG